MSFLASDHPRHRLLLVACLAVLTLCLLPSCTRNGTAVPPAQTGDPSSGGATPVGPVHVPVPGPVVSWPLGADPTGAAPTGIDRATSLATKRYGFDTGYARLDDGTVLAWGNNRAGELGEATSDDDPHLDPAPIQGLSSVVAVADVFGDEDPAAVDTDGRVWLWGRNHAHDAGVRGPTLLPGVDHVTKVVGAFALCQDGTVWSWASSATPAPVPGLAGAIGIDTIGPLDVVVVQADGTAWITPQHPSDADRPVRLTGMGDATALVGAGGQWAFAAAANGTLWALPSATGGHEAVQVVELTDVTKVVRTRDAGYLALRSDGSLWAFTYPLGGASPALVAPLPPVADVAVVGDRVYAIVNP